MAQSNIQLLFSAQVMISPFLGLSPASSSLLAVWSLFDIFLLSLSLSAPPPCMCTCFLFLSFCLSLKINFKKCLKKRKKHIINNTTGFGLNAEATSKGLSFFFSLSFHICKKEISVSFLFPSRDSVWAL